MASQVQMALSNLQTSLTWLTAQCEQYFDLLSGSQGAQAPALPPPPPQPEGILASFPLGLQEQIAQLTDLLNKSDFSSLSGHACNLWPVVISVGVLPLIVILLLGKLGLFNVRRVEAEQSSEQRETKEEEYTTKEEEAPYRTVATYAADSSREVKAALKDAKAATQEAKTAAKEAKSEIQEAKTAIKEAKLTIQEAKSAAKAAKDAAVEAKDAAVKAKDAAVEAKTIAKDAEKVSDKVKDLLKEMKNAGDDRPTGENTEANDDTK